MSSFNTIFRYLSYGYLFRVTLFYIPSLSAKYSKYIIHWKTLFKIFSLKKKSRRIFFNYSLTLFLSYIAYHIKSKSTHRNAKTSCLRKKIHVSQSSFFILFLNTVFLCLLLWIRGINTRHTFHNLSLESSARFWIHIIFKVPGNFFF